MQVELSEANEARIRKFVAEGHCSSADDVISRALGLLEGQRAAYWSHIRDLVGEAEAAIRQGRERPVDSSLMAEVTARAAHRRANS